MLTVETIGRIRREFFVQGKTIKEIARDLRVSRNTVRKIVRSGATAIAYDRETQPRPKLGRWTADLEELGCRFVRIVLQVSTFAGHSSPRPPPSTALSRQPPSVVTQNKPVVVTSWIDSHASVWDRECYHFAFGKSRDVFRAATNEHASVHIRRR